LIGEPRWEQIVTSGSPPYFPGAPVMVWDEEGDRVVLHGGEFDGYANSDTWVLDLRSGEAAWSRLETVGDAPRLFSHCGIYDPVRNRLVIHGGAQFRTSSYALDLEGTPTWRSIKPSGPTPPEEFTQATVFDPVRRRAVVWGGSHSGLDRRTFVFPL